MFTVQGSAHGGRRWSSEQNPDCMSDNQRISSCHYCHVTNTCHYHGYLEESEECIEGVVGEDHMIVHVLGGGRESHDSESTQRTRP